LLDTPYHQILKKYEVPKWAIKSQKLQKSTFRSV
jgi:hypothetical protein